MNDGRMGRAVPAGRRSGGGRRRHLRPRGRGLTEALDPVRQQRARAARLAAVGKRVGFSLFGLAISVFLVGLLTTFSDAVADTVVACLVVGSIVLAPAIILGYATKAAERQDLERGL